MAAAEFRKKALFFIVFAGVNIIILMVLPFVIGWLRHDVLPQFGMVFNPGSWDLNTDRGTPPMMVQTTASLIENLLHVFRIILWMSLTISIVRFLTYLIFGTAFRSEPRSRRY